MIRIEISGESRLSSVLQKLIVYWGLSKALESPWDHVSPGSDSGPNTNLQVALEVREST